MAGISDIRHELCLALALWNGNDPILKERMFGLTGPQGNHGEDVKEYWWYLEGLPSHALLHWRYHYPQAAFPYEQLLNHGRGLQDPELELLDTGVFDGDRYWSVDVTYAKASPTEVLMRIELENHGPDEATLHVLPTLWFRNTWEVSGDDVRPRIAARRDGLEVADHRLAGYRLDAAPGPDGLAPEALFCENESNAPRVFGAEATTPYPKDGINDHVVSGAATVNPDGTGTKAALRYRVTAAGGGKVELRLRLRGPDEHTHARLELGRADVRRRMARPRERCRRVLRRTCTGRDPARADADPAPVVRGACLEQADVSVQRELAGWTATRARRLLPRRTAMGATATGGTWTRSTCSRCRTRGSTPGSPPGISGSMRSPGRISIRHSRSTS